MSTQRLASGGDQRSEAERIFDLTDALASEVQCVQDPESRFQHYGEILNHVMFRARADWFETTGDEMPPLDGSAA